MDLPLSDCPSLTFVCPRCGTAWAQVQTLRRDWTAVLASCLSHEALSPEFEVPGSTLTILGWYSYTFTNLPSALRLLSPEHLRLEFEAHFSELERYLCPAHS